MRVMPIRIMTGKSGWHQMKASFKKNWKHYLQEALGLAIFMISACFFSAMFFSEGSSWYRAIPSFAIRNMLMGVMMGLTAIFIFYSRWTAPSGSQINPAVTITFLRLGNMCRYDALFFIIFQFAGGTAAVYLMDFLMGTMLTGVPVNSAVTIPGRLGAIPALITEFIIAFITMTVVLFTSNNDRLKKYSRIFTAFLVCAWVILAGPISGFGMNPARTFASALPADTWSAFWLYMISPLAGMLGAAECYVRVKKKKRRTIFRVVHRQNEFINNQLEQHETDLKITSG